MKILQVSAALDQGGVERGTVEMASYIVSQGAQSFVVSQGGRLVSLLEDQGSQHFYLPLARRNPVTIFYCAVKIRTLIKQLDIDLVHVRSRAPAWAVWIACQMTGVPFVTTFHGTHRLQNRFKRIYNSIMTRGERVIAISRFIRQHIIDNYDVDDSLIDIAPRGFDPNRIAPGKVAEGHVEALRKELALKNDTPVIILPGRLTRWKGQILFLQALALIKDNNWQALLIGGEDKKAFYLAELKQMVVDSGIAARVHFVGAQSDIAPYYALADLVVSASTEPEAFGRVAVEAQAMGKPVIASAHGGSLETVLDGESGWLFTNNSAEDLAEKLSQALKSKDRWNTMGLSARRFVNVTYTVEQMCQAEWSTYRKILKR